MAQAFAQGARAVHDVPAQIIRVAAGTASDRQRGDIMKTTRVLGLAAIGAMLVLAAPTPQAQALSLANPASVTAIEASSKASTMQVHWHPSQHRRCRYCRR